MSYIENIKIREISSDELSAVAALLDENALPSKDLNEAKVNLLVATSNGAILGSVGYEQYQHIALMRSMVVAKEYRRNKIGEALLSKLVDTLKAKGVKHIYLLTSDAKHYFFQQGFDVVERKYAPDEIKKTSEFNAGCPNASLVMCKNI